MKQTFILFSLLLCSMKSWSQQKMLPLHTFYKDPFMQHSGKKSIETMYPANESQLNLHYIIRDSSMQYYDFTDWLFKRHWLEYKNEFGSISISPMINATYGKEPIDDSLRSTIFQNTRGVYVEGQFFDNFSFNFILAENQARFMQYEADYFRSRGQIYTIGQNYIVDNAVIPGAARTKPFNEDGFDYAFSVGNFRYKASEKLSFEAGNTGHFIGNGYRSLLLSDNSVAAPYLRTNWNINSKWSYSFLFKQHNNLYRKPVFNTVEGNFEKKLFSATYLTYKPIENLSISLFTAGNSLRGDSLIKHPIQAQMFIPLPFVNTDLFVGNGKLVNGISGINIDFALEKKRIYGQWVVDKINKTFMNAFQTGIHFFDAWNIKNLHTQFEVNYVPKGFYASENPKLAYSHYQLPSAHPRGNNFVEGLFRFNYEYKRFFVESRSVLQQNQGIGVNQFIPHSIFTSLNDNSFQQTAYGSTFIQHLEMGYRVNRKYNGMFVLGCKIRSSEFLSLHELNQMIYFSLRSGLLNQYFDF
jgi:hypothetical protein